MSSVADTASLFTSKLEALQVIEDDERPSSLYECRSEDGVRIDAKLYQQCLQKEEEITEAEEGLYHALHADVQRRKRPNRRKKARKHYRGVKSRSPYRFDEEGKQVFLQPRQTVWYCLCALRPPPDDPKFKKKFRRRFRMPYQEYKKLLEMVKSHHLFARWRRKDAVGRMASPVELLLLGALRYLGRGLTFDDLEEYTAMHEETHRIFFHTFIKCGASVLHPLYVKYPTNQDEYARHMPEFSVGGLPGAGFSADATNVIMWRCQQPLSKLSKVNVYMLLLLHLSTPETLSYSLLF